MAILSLPLSLCLASQPTLRLDKAIKKVSAQKRPITAIALPEALPETTDLRLRLIAEAARHGYETTFIKTPESDDALTCFYDGEPMDLRIPNDLCDWHAHTQFAYCGRGIDIKDAADFSLELGLHTQGFAEHAFALYFPSNALKFYWQSDRPFVEAIWATPNRARMVAYKALVQNLRTHYQGRVKFGLEVDLFGGGDFCLAPQDAEGWDYLIGAIHEIEGITPKSTQAEIEQRWMEDLERLLEMPIQILAHPFRYFPWYKHDIPRHFYRPVAKRLAEKKIAAEINHHANPFELDFFKICLEEGVKLSLGTDAHITRNIADMLPHLETLEALGIHTAQDRKDALLQL